MSLRFEWDPNKAEANLAKHEISFEEAMTVFADPLARIFPDEEQPVDEETLRSEYRFDYSKSKPNRFAAEMSKGTVAIVLEPDVAEVFRSSEVVNDLLRSIIAAIPSSKRERRANRAT